MLPSIPGRAFLVAPPDRLARESAAARRDGLSRMRNDRTIAPYRRAGLPVELPGRTATIPQGLRRSNPSAVPADGAGASTHLTGAPLDLSKRALSDQEATWLGAVPYRLRRLGLVHAVEEFGEPQFHATVRRRYADDTRRHGSAIFPPGC